MKFIPLLLLSVGLLFAQNPNTAVFPGAIADDEDLLVQSNLAQTTLNGTIDASTLSINLTNAAGFTFPGVVVVGSEIIKVCSKATNALTVCTGGRGFEGTTAASHTSGVGVFGYLTSYAHNQLAAEMKAVQAAIPLTFPFVFNLASPAAGDDGIYTILNPPVAVKITRLSCGITGTTSVVVNFVKGGASIIADETVTAGDVNHHTVTTFANGASQCGSTSYCAVAAHTPVTLHIGTITDTPTNLACSGEYTKN
jgi:hypothetical protein